MPRGGVPKTFAAFAVLCTRVETVDCRLYRGDQTVLLFLAFVMVLSVAQAACCQMVGWSVSDYFEGMWQLAIMLLFRRFPESDVRLPV
jgi:hypothetical protein